MVLAPLGKHAKAVAVRQIQVQQNNFEIAVLLDQLLRLTASCSFQDGGVASQFLENATQGLADQDVIVDQQKLHEGHRCRRRCDSTSEPARKYPRVATGCAGQAVDYSYFFCTPRLGSQW
jgi:hypothetical protein